MTLITECQPRVMACICSMIHNMTEAEEVYQQACLVMWRKFDSYQPGTQFAKWACSIAYLEVIRHLRKRPVCKCFDKEFVDRLASRSEQDPSVGEDNRRIQTLRSCMGRLASGARRLLELRYWERKMVKEIAEELGRTPQSVCNSLGRIRAKLMECVERSLVIEDRR